MPFTKTITIFRQCINSQMVTIIAENIKKHISLTLSFLTLLARDATVQRININTFLGQISSVCAETAETPAQLRPPSS